MGGQRWFAWEGWEGCYDRKALGIRSFALLNYYDDGEQNAWREKKGGGVGQRER